MKKRISILTLAILLLSLTTGFSQKSKKREPIENELDSVSYALGISSAGQFKNLGLTEINALLFLQAINDEMSEEDLSEFTINESTMLLQQFFTELQAKQGKENIDKANAFLAENKKKEGVIELPSGLQYKVLVEGTGASPTDEEHVEVHYHGTLIDGTVFDSSRDRGESIEFGVTQVIKGWTEALKLMKVGSKWMLYIPPSLAYGDRAAGSIPPNSALIFEVELLGIHDAASHSHDH